MILWNDCNLYHKQTRDELTSTFNNRENSWEWCDYLKSIRPIEHANAKPFSVVRSELVRSANSTLDETSVNAVVWATAGMLKLEIERIARTYQPGDRLPERPRTDWCRDPLTGEYAERLFDPFDLVEKLKRLKLKARVRHAFRRFPLHLLNAVSVRGINKLLFSMKPAFIVIAEKPATI